ncbi:MAG: BTAD domain-containing putative transcriptional regulator [Actinomycetota bacterium]
MLNLRLLGPLTVVDEEGRDVTPPGARERIGLVTLAVVSPDPLSTERIADELYREREATDPRNAVQAMVSRLRRALGRSAGSVQTTTTGYRLVDVMVDIDEAEQLLGEAAQTEDLSTATDLLKQAADLWRGPTMDGLDGDLINGERLRIDNLRADTEDHLFERRLGERADPGLVTALEAGVADQPLRERRWELLMRTLYQQGRQADALRAFQRARSMLSTHLGLEPGPRLVQLEQRILAHDPSLDQETASTEEADRRQADTAASDGPAGNPPTTGSADRPMRHGHPPPSGTVSLLLCDVEGSVRQWESSPEDTAREIEELHRIWTAETERAGGFLVKSTGDGILAAFSTAGAAVTAAISASAAQHDLPLMVKVAINTGAVEPTNGDYRGPVINRCARLLDLANGGQILMSGTTAELAKADLATADTPVTMRDLGTHWLRDVSEPLTIWQVSGPGVRSSFPALQSNGPRSLPRPRGELLGRADLAARIVETVDGHPLVTLLGPGGIGKTSLALSVGWDLAGTRPVTFVDLARVTDPSTVETRMVEVIDPDDRDDDRSPVDRIADQLRSNPDLVVIDNAEHVLDAVATVVEQIVGQEIKGAFLVTSRHPLGLPEETIIGVPPLEVPADGDDLDMTGQAPSVQLFVQRAKAVRPDFEIPNGLLPVVAHICRRLDGIPLAIELAAGRTSLLSLDDIAARLDDQLRLLRQVRANRDRRHQSLEAVVGWSVDQLSQPAREVFVRLSVMAGSFGLHAVESLLRHSGVESIDVLEALDELHQASLLRVEPEGSRFRMLEPIRQVAEAELAARELVVPTRRAHVEWVTELVSDAHRRRDTSRAEALARLDEEADQLLAAATWATETAQTDLLPRLAFDSGWWFLTRQSKLGSRLIAEMLPLFDRTEQPLGWAEVRTALAIVTAAAPSFGGTDELVEATRILDEHDHPDRGIARLATVYASDLSPGAPDPAPLLAEVEELLGPDDAWGRALLDMTFMTVMSLLDELPPASDLEGLLTKVRAAVTTFRQLGETWVLGATLAELGRLFLSIEDLDEAEACFAESLELLADSDFHGRHNALTELGKMASLRGDHALAARYHADAMIVAESDEHPNCIAVTLAGMAHAAEYRGEPALAIDFYRRADAMASGTPIFTCLPGEWTEAIERLEQTAD